MSTKIKLDRRNKVLVLHSKVERLQFTIYSTYFLSRGKKNTFKTPLIKLWQGESDTGYPDLIYTFYTFLEISLCTP